MRDIEKLEQRLRNYLSLLNCSVFGTAIGCNHSIATCSPIKKKKILATGLTLFSSHALACGMTPLAKKALSLIQPILNVETEAVIQEV